MKKLILVLAVLFALGIVSSARAEMSAQSYSGKAAKEQQVFADFYNNFGDTITENTVVMLDTAAATYASTGTLYGAYITVPTAIVSNSQYVIGVTDEYIPTGAVGRVCIRGPHKVYATSGYTSNQVVPVGQNPTLGNLAGSAYGATGHAATYVVADGTAGGHLGWFMASDNVVGSVWWIWINPQVHR